MNICQITRSKIGPEQEDNKLRQLTQPSLETTNTTITSAYRGFAVADGCIRDDEAEEGVG